MEAWSLSYQLSALMPKGKTITPQQLLGKAFDGKGAQKGKHPQTEEEFRAYKKELKRVARWHASIYKDVIKGRKKSIPVDSNTLLVDKHSIRT